MILSSIFFPNIKIKNHEISIYWIFPLIGALILLIFKIIDFDYFIHSLVNQVGVNPLEILILFISMVFISIVLDEVGFFKYLAQIAIKKAHNNQIVLFILYYLIISILTIFTSNDIIIITFTPFLIFFTKNAKINPLPYLIMEFVSSNTWSMLLLIGNPTNIYLGSSFNQNINFLSYIEIMGLPTLLSGLLSFLILFLLFKKELKKPIDVEITEVDIKDKYIFLMSLILLISCIILLAISNFIGIKMYLISLISSLILLIFLIIYTIIKKEKRSILLHSVKRLPFNLIPLLLSMFTLVLGLGSSGATKYLSELLTSNNEYLNILSYGFSSFFLANLINNIPMSILYVDILEHASNVSIFSVYASIIASNICAFLTPLGALAGVMWMNILRKNNIKMNYLMFTKYGLIISIPTLLIGLLGLMLIFLII